MIHRIIYRGPFRQQKRDDLDDRLLCGIVTNYRTLMEDVLEVEEFCQWLDDWDVQIPAES